MRHSVYTGLFLLICSLGNFAIATDRCVYLKRSAYPQERSLNLVFVPSGFGNDLDSYEEAVRESWPTISQFEPFSDGVDSLNVIIAKPTGHSGRLCRQHNSIARVFRCETMQGRRLADNCLSDTNRHVMIVNNSAIYGASGLREGSNVNIGNAAAARQIVHELGHAMFSLSDEYTDRNASVIGQNCTGNRNCAPWQDLIAAGMASCRPGCRSNAKFTSEETIMDVLESNTFGHVNTRLICCVFKDQTGAYPRICDPYRHIGAGLDAFCRSR